MVQSAPIQGHRGWTAGGLCGSAKFATPPFGGLRAARKDARGVALASSFSRARLDGRHRSYLVGAAGELRREKSIESSRQASLPLRKE